MNTPHAPSTTDTNSLAESSSLAVDKLADSVDAVRAQAGPAINRMVSEADQLTRRGIAAVRDGSQRLTEQTQRAADSTVAYIKDEPVKAVLIAAAVGAGLMALVTLVSRVGTSRG